PLLVGVGLVLAWWARAGADHVLLLELAGPWAVGFVLALLARARLDEPADVVVPALALVLLTLVLRNPLGRWVELFPLGPGFRTVPVWWAVVGTSAGAAALAVREWRWRVR
ncbi:MAG: hypothetical protein M3P04_11560, partial [Actinomycetota bacterium]|nr:hypothetical protein [Actinomycetota bacterium]